MAYAPPYVHGIECSYDNVRSEDDMLYCIDTAMLFYTVLIALLKVCYTNLIERFHLWQMHVFSRFLFKGYTECPFQNRPHFIPSLQKTVNAIRTAFVAWERGTQGILFRDINVAPLAVVWRYGHEKEDGYSLAARTGCIVRCNIVHYYLTKLSTSVWRCCAWHGNHRGLV